MIRVKVYRNLRKKCFSVVDVKTGRVFKHQHHVVLKDATFRVSQAGRARVLREKRKNVHAYVVGELLTTNFSFPDLKPREAYYNPYKCESFVNRRSRNKVSTASLVMLAPGNIFYWR